MVKEWNDKYNSFNSFKGLLYIEWYKAILRGEFLPPIEASIDPVNTCNFDCLWCNNAMTKARGVMMRKNHLLDLFQFFRDWGVKGICIAGGGEPTLHPHLGEAIFYAHALNMPIALMTNGTFLGSDDGLLAAASCCRWIGVSVDCANRETFKKLKGSDSFNKVLTNIKRLVELGGREIVYKFLLHPENQNEVFEAIELARLLGCQRIHIRPVSFMNFQDQEENYDIDSIDRQVEKGRAEFETEKFGIFYIRHKYNTEMHRTFGFSKCRATPLMPIFHANGDMSLCVDRKNDKSMVFGSHEKIDEIRKIWGGIEHKAKIQAIDLEECPKCTFNEYNTQIEKCVINNSMDFEFC